MFPGFQRQELICCEVLCFYIIFFPILSLMYHSQNWHITAVTKQTTKQSQIAVTNLQ